MVKSERPETAAQLLKHHTLQQHLLLEEMVLPRLLSLQTVGDYMRFLKCFYGYFKPVESLIEQQVDESILPDIKQRRKAALILQDLTFLKAHTDDLLFATALPEIKNKPQAFGAMYVLEGSTLGGRGITKMLLKNNDLKLTGEQVQFFAGYGAETGTMWMAFLKTLNAFGNDASAIALMITTANETFLLFKNWLLQNDK